MPNDFGKKLLIEECQIIDVSDVLKQYRKQLKELLLTSQLELLGKSITLATTPTPFGGTRFWFSCPTCGSRVGKIIIEPLGLGLGCRKCLGARYRKQRFKGMVELGNKQ